MISKIQAMQFIYTNYEIYKELSLSKGQVEIISWLNRSQATSADLSEMQGISIQNASQQLKSLYKKGYLERFELKDPTGGYIFEYTANSELFNEELL